MLKRLIKRIFPHRHGFRQVGYVYHTSRINRLSASPQTAKIYRCRCGQEERRLTDAGNQQAGWGDNVEEILGFLGNNDCTSIYLESH